MHWNSDLPDDFIDGTSMRAYRTASAIWRIDAILRKIGLRAPSRIRHYYWG
jgi:hypothetical protein